MKYNACHKQLAIHAIFVLLTLVMSVVVFSMPITSLETMPNSAGAGKDLTESTKQLTMNNHDVEKLAELLENGTTYDISGILYNMSLQDLSKLLNIFSTNWDNSSASKIAFWLEFVPESRVEPALNTLPIIHRAQVLNILVEGKYVREHFACPPPAACTAAPAYILPSVDFSTMLSGLLINATSTQIKEIPLTEYSSDDLAKALYKLPQEKRILVLDSLDNDKRSEVSHVLKTLKDK